ncbi:restriction endonuclease subunit S [Shewanella sp. 125m-1]
MTTRLPEGCKMVKFANIANQISKRVEPTETELQIYVGLEHLDPDNLKIKRHGVPSDVTGQKLLVKKGQIIFGKRRAYQRKVAVADWDCICSAHAMVLEANSDNVIPEFLPIFMQSDSFMDRAVAVSEGSLSPTIKWKVLCEQKFKIPSFQDQEKIVNVYNKLLSNQVKLDGFILSSLSLKAALEKQFSYIKDYKKIGDVTAFVTSGSRGWSKFCGNEGDLFLRITNMTRGRINLDLSDTKYVKLPSKNSEGARTKVQNGDVLVSITADLGLVSLIEKGVETAYVNQHIALLRPDKTINSDYLAFMLSSKFGQRLLGSLNDGGAKAGISLKNLKELRIPMPNLSIQTKIAKPLRELQQTIIKEENYKKNLLTMRKAILENYVG